MHFTLAYWCENCLLLTLGYRYTTLKWKVGVAFCSLMYLIIKSQGLHSISAFLFLLASRKARCDISISQKLVALLIDFFNLCYLGVKAKVTK